MPQSWLSVREILAGRAPKEAPVTVKGWVRTRRDSKAGISFVHVSDGSSFHPVQVVAPNTLENYADVQRLTAGCAVEAATDPRDGSRCRASSRRRRRARGEAPIRAPPSR